MKNFINRNDKFVTVHRKRSKIPPSTSVHFATRVWKSRVFRQSWSSRLFMRAAASRMPAINSSPVSIFLFYISLFIQPHKQKLNGFKQLSLGHHTALYTCLYVIFSHNDRYLHVPEYWSFLQKEPVWPNSICKFQCSQTLRSYSMPKI